MLLLLVPVLGVVRTTLTAEGEVTADATDAVLRREVESMGGAYWEAWAVQQGPPGWALLPENQNLVGISFNGYGSLPAGMESSEPRSQKFTFKLKCLDPPDQRNPLGLGLESKFIFKTHHHSWGRTEGKAHAQHMEGNGVHVFHEKAGDYPRPEGARRYIIDSQTLNCNNLEVHVDQVVYMDQAMLAQQSQAKRQRLAEAGYSSAEIQAGLEAYHRKVFENLFDEDGRMVMPNLGNAEQEHAEKVRALVASGALKRPEDYRLLQDAYSANQANTNEEGAGYFDFGHSTIKGIQVPEGKHVLALEFEQNCAATSPSKISSKMQKLGSTSPLNCHHGAKGVLVLHGQRRKSELFHEDDFTADRLVLYLKQ